MKIKMAGSILEHNWLHLAFILKEIKFQKKMKKSYNILIYI
ncbi:Hypothetical protein ACI5QL_01905 [Bacillus velezensis]|nr:hypothetical protein BAMY6614_12925 [Bacillus amyloliquefaciens UMAF6614]ERH59158.1 hypothetical protein O205_00620 [Bacillus amyloliquefaciens EGD-AQ14]RUS01042.1 hypothetical protein EFW58_01073 [Bacillus velezensis]